MGDREEKRVVRPRPALPFFLGTRKKIIIPKSRLGLGQIDLVRLSKTAGLTALIRGFYD